MVQYERDWNNEKFCTDYILNKIWDKYFVWCSHSYFLLPWEINFFDVNNNNNNNNNINNNNNNNSNNNNINKEIERERVIFCLVIFQACMDESFQRRKFAGLIFKAKSLTCR